ncbi:MAG TPA: DEAD/DEAH box helicase, partial [Armatimonadota bacterium]|nr:DEAD/DEAH box helicase [Armatimonadota bacterium]
LDDTAVSTTALDPEGVSGRQVGERMELLRRLAERADLVVIDESHNFRTRSSNRYGKLFWLLQPLRGRKQIVLLTATPLNTYFTDLSSQLALITHERGTIGGIGMDQMRKAAVSLDRGRTGPDASGALSLQPGVPAGDILDRVLQQVMIQRSRTTCRALSAAAGRELLFPQREGPECVEYTIGPESQGYRDLIDLADRRFRPGVRYFDEVRQFIRKEGADAQSRIPARLLHGPPPGVKLAAFVLEQYRRHPVIGAKRYQDEIHLARLVFANMLKQLESSPPALQGILQSLGIGLLARLQFVFGATAASEWRQHLEWVRTPLFKEKGSGPADGDTAQARRPAPPGRRTEGGGTRTEDEGRRTDDGDESGSVGDAAETDAAVVDRIDDGETLDASGAEVDDWLDSVVRSRKLNSKLEQFQAESDEYDLDRWKADILGDLGFLREIHEAVLRARTQPDPKLEKIAPIVARETEVGRRVLVFTQSIRTAEYLERELKDRLLGRGIARIDSRVEDTRAAIIHAFCPGYNPPRSAPSVPARVDVLISTDVLSEGVNLQEAGAIVNYDIHWNPVRLIQRIGRVDRRLNPAVTAASHRFTIYNVLPPPEIEAIINLIAMVEDRTLKISRAVGIDQAFLSGDDPANSLKEFNHICEGEMTRVDSASADYVRQFDTPDPEMIGLLNALPPGAFGVWAAAPFDGLFALYTMEASADATERDREKFAAVIDRPVLALDRPGQPPLFNAGEILQILSGTRPKEPSGTPSDETDLAARQKRLRNAVRGHFGEIALPGTIRPRLVCWIELRQSARGHQA